MVQFVRGRREINLPSVNFLQIMMRAFGGRSEAVKNSAVDAAQKHLDSAKGLIKELFTADGFERYFKSLWDGDREAWAKFLFALSGDKGDPLFNEFKKFSPFAGADVVVVHYGAGSVIFSGNNMPLRRDGRGVSFAIGEFIKSKGWTVYDDEYVVVLDGDSRPSEAFCIGHGKKEVSNPRKRIVRK